MNKYYSIQSNLQTDLDKMLNDASEEIIGLLNGQQDASSALVQSLVELFVSFVDTKLQVVTKADQLAESTKETFQNIAADIIAIQNILTSGTETLEGVEKVITECTAKKETLVVAYKAKVEERDIAFEKLDSEYNSTSDVAKNIISLYKGQIGTYEKLITVKD